MEFQLVLRNGRSHLEELASALGCTGRRGKSNQTSSFLAKDMVEVSR